MLIIFNDGPLSNIADAFNSFHLIEAMNSPPRLSSKNASSKSTLNSFSGNEATAHHTPIRKVESLLRDEVLATQKVLALQQCDNHRFQEHVRILDGEIDSLRTLLGEKQQIINSQNAIILEKDDRIKELERLLHENKIEKHALKTFERQNGLLLDELRETKMQMEELEVEVRFLRDLKDDRTEYTESKMKMVAEMEIKLNGQSYEYKYT